MGNNLNWNVKNEERQINFIFDFFMKDRDFRRNYRQENGATTEITRMAIIIDQIIEVITIEGKSYEIKYLVDELNYRRINYEIDKTVEKKYVKDLMVQLFENQCISSSSFSWIDENDSRVCNFVYSYLMSSSLKENNLVCLQKIHLKTNSGIFNNIETADSKTRRIHNQLKLTYNQNNNADKIKYIKNFFDLLDIDKKSMEKALEDLNEKWLHTQKDNSMLQWLINNESLISWAWNYTIANLLDNKTPSWAYITSSTEKELIENERIAIITLYDLLDAISKEVFISKIKSNGSQQKYRKKLSDRKPSNIPLTEKHKKMLKDLANKENKTQYEILEMLIENAYMKSQ